MKLLALFPERMNPQGIASFVESSLGEGWEVTGVGEADEDVAALEAAEAILAALADLRAPAIARASGLRMIQTPSHGFDHIDIEAAAERSVPVCNVGTSGAEAGTVAEHAILLMLACARKLIDGHEGIRGGEWPQLTGTSLELQGKSLGIVGLGHIGREVAKRARAFGMSVSYYDAVQAGEEVESELDVTFVTDLGQLMEQSQVVTVHVPLMETTKGLIGAAEIARLPRDAILVNTSRGPVVDNQAVAEAADAGLIMAGIDVFDPEPPPVDHPLRLAKNVVLSPHVAGTTRESVGRIMMAALENLRRFGRGDPLHDVVNGVQS